MKYTPTILVTGGTGAIVARLLNF